MTEEGSQNPEFSDADTSDPASAALLSVPDDYAPRRREGVLEIDMGDGLILFDDDASLVHHLNPSATLIWQLCDGTGTVQQLARDIANGYGLDASSLTTQVAVVVAELDALELVEDATGNEVLHERATSYIVGSDP